MIALAAGVAVLLFALIKRRVGPLAALALAILVLFLGLTPEVLLGRTMMWSQATAAGLAAFLALDLRSRRGDALACLLLIVAVLSFEVGTAFVIGAGAWILAERGSRRIWRSLIIPLGLYAAWWVWALQFDQTYTIWANLLLTPAWTADSLAAAAAVLTGLGFDFSGGSTTPDVWTQSFAWGGAGWPRQ